jgi:hypothetical protein
MNGFWKRSKNFLTPLFFALLLGLFGWFVARPFHAKIRIGMNRIEEVRAEKEMQAELASRLPEIRRQAEEVAAEEEILETVIPEGRIVPLVETWEALARDAGVEIEIEARQEPAGKPTKTDPKKSGADGSKETLRGKLPMQDYLEVSVRLTGEYGAIRNFLYRFETLRFATDVLSVEIGPAKDTEGNPGASRDLFREALPSEGSDGAVAGHEEPAGTARLQAVLSVAVYVQK